MRSRYAPPLLVLVAVGALYARVLHYDWTGLDDTVLIADQQAWLARPGHVLDAFTRTYFAAGDAYYRPLVTVSYLADAQWSGGRPFGFHLSNVALHAFASLLVYSLLRRLQFSEWLSALGAACFAAHPAVVEAVAWVPGRNDSLLAIFGLAAWLALDRARTRPRWTTRALHLTAFTAALFTKETAIVLPLLYLAYLWIVDRPAARSRWMWAGWITVLAGYLLVRAQVVPPAGAPSRLQALSHLLPAVLTGLGKLVVPVQLTPIAVLRDSALWPGVLAVALVLGLVRAATGARRPVLVLAGVLAVAPMLPGLLSPRLLLENRLYLPAVGLALFVAELTRALDRRLAAVVLVHAALALRYQSTFRNPEAFTAAAVAGSPHSSLAHLQRGIWLQRARNDLDGAAAEYRTAIECDPAEAMAHNNLAVVLMSQRRWADAESALRAELAYHPGSATAHYNLGLVLSRLGRPDEAAAEWEETLRHQPDHIDALGELMVEAQRRGDEARARRYRDELVRHGATLLPGDGR